MTFPDKVYLIGCPAERLTDAGNPNPPVSLRGGLFDVLDFQPFEPANYCWEAGWEVCATDDPAEFPDVYFVTVDDFEKQVWPSSHAGRLQMERDMDIAEEMERI